MAEIGDRVGAVLSAKNGIAELLGYGIYEGDFVPEEAVGWIADIIREQKRGNPRIRLDSGKVVYGCECWWGDEDAVKKRMDVYDRIVEVDIDEVRKDANNPSKT